MEFVKIVFTACLIYVNLLDDSQAECIKVKTLHTIMHTKYEKEFSKEPNTSFYESTDRYYIFYDAYNTWFMGHMNQQPEKAEIKSKSNTSNSPESVPRWLELAASGHWVYSTLSVVCLEQIDGNSGAIIGGLIVTVIGVIGAIVGGCYCYGTRTTDIKICNCFNEICHFQDCFNVCQCPKKDIEEYPLEDNAQN